MRALDLATGRELWKQAYPGAYEMNPAATGHGKGPKSTATLAEGRLFTFGITGVLSAWNAADGRLLWRKSFESSHRATSPAFGAAMSPPVDGGRLIAHVGGDGDGALVALDAATGKALWSWKGDGPGYASPVAATFDGMRHVVTQSQNALVAVAADSGALLWTLALKTPYEQNSVTPIVSGGLVVYSGLDVPLYGMGGAAADFDNDGRQDLFVTAVGQSRLFRNTGSGRFVDVTERAGLGGRAGFSTSALWVDYDRDGLLDLVVFNYVPPACGGLFFLRGPSRGGPTPPGAMRSPQIP